MFLFIRLIFCFVIIYPFCDITLAADSDGDFIVVNDNNVTNFVGNNLNNGDGCWYLLESFANVSANFTFCAITNARPITLCQGCVTPYVLAVEVHKDILKLMNEVGELCKEKLLNLDRLQVVEGGIGYISGLWKRAACDLCYETDAEGLPTKLKSNVKKLTDLHNQTITCIQNHMENDTDSSNGKTIYDRQVCTECKSLYLELNSEYNHFKDDSPFCMDIIDMVNTTRNLWSVTLGCCLDRQKPELTFIISSGIISVLPVLFYLIACRFTGKKEHTVVINKNSSTSHCNNVQQSDCDTTVSPGPSSDHEFTEKTVLINSETLNH